MGPDYVCEEKDFKKYPYIVVVNCLLHQREREVAVVKLLTGVCVCVCVWY